MTEPGWADVVAAAQLAHEIRNVLSIVRASSTILREAIPAADAEADAILDDLIAAADRASDLSHELMALSRRACATPAEPVDLGASVAHLAESVRRMAPANVAVEVEVERGTLTSLPVRDIQLVLVNLARNAFEAMPEGGTLSIRVIRVTDGIAWSIGDTGVGMDDTTRLRCCAAFFTTKRAGHGLGLHAVRDVVERHAGRLAIASAPGRGTTVTILLS